MRKILITILILLLVAGFGITLTSGISIGNFKILSVKQIIENNKSLDGKIATLSSAVTTEYAKARSDLDASTQKLKTSKLL